tara:strand:+ start:199218 stop:200756 length:1539 start_codon:yes stop_codon:yes gene_type:complete
MFLGVNTQHFMPHGHCIMWTPQILFPIVISDIIIFLSYTSIPVALYIFQSKRSDLTDNSRLVLILFFLFIFLCGITHAISAWNYWHANYVLDMFVKVLTALVSMATAIKLFQLLPTLIKLPSITEYDKVIKELKKVNDELERRVEKRTQEIQEKNKLLSTVLNGISEGIVQYYPIYNENDEVIDFRNKALNQNAFKESEYKEIDQLESDSVKSFPGIVENGHFDRCLKAWNESTTVIVDPSYNSFHNRFYREVVHRPANENYLVVYFTDVTDREEMKINKLTQTKLLALGELAGGIAHEINTPLQVLSGYSRKVERSLSEELKTQNQENFKVINETLKFINQLIKNLKSLSRGNASTVVEINISEFFEKSLFFLEQRLSNNNIQLIKNYSHNEIKSINFNEVSLFQITTNLLKNAMDSVIEKHETDKEHKSIIEINLIKNDHEVIIEIADNGIGIDDKIIHKIFDPLFTTKGENKGTGLGLSLSQKLAMDMGARLRVIQDDMTRFQLVVGNE